jgi:hypothetical protein
MYFTEVNSITSHKIVFISNSTLVPTLVVVGERKTKQGRCDFLSEVTLNIEPHWGKQPLLSVGRTIIYRVSHEEMSIFCEITTSVILRKKYVYVYISYSERFLRYSYFTEQYTVHCTDVQRAMSTHELQSALILTVEFSKMYYTR